MLRACVYANEELSAAMRRIELALIQHAPPDVEAMRSDELADLVVVHAVGYPDTLEAIERIKARGQRYAMIQYCVRSTQEPGTDAWLEMWAGADLVWSYYDLPELMAEDGVSLEELRFYHSPLGVDPGVFRFLPAAGERYAILTSGYVAESECVEECSIATERVGRTMFHLGPELACHGSHVTSRLGITDDELARIYNQCDFVAGLRRVEGFEMPAAEGLCCGARPIVFDAPHYRQWFDDSAVFVPEVDADELIPMLEEIFRAGVKPVTVEERQAAQRLFNWGTIVPVFWREITRRMSE
jgi:hypothetical protein